MRVIWSAISWSTPPGQESRQQGQVPADGAGVGEEAIERDDGGNRGEGREQREERHAAGGREDAIRRNPIEDPPQDIAPPARAGSARVYSRHDHDPVRRHARDRPERPASLLARPRRASRGLYRFAPGARRARAPRESTWSASTWVRLLGRVYLGAFGTGRVSPRSAGRRSSLGACPVVVPRTAGFDVFGASGSAGWLGSGVSGGGRSMLMPSPSSRGLVEVSAAATLPLMSSAARARYMFLMDLILGGHSRAATRRNTRSSRDPPPTGPWETTPPRGTPSASVRQLTTIVPHRATARRSSRDPAGPPTDLPRRPASTPRSRSRARDGAAAMEPMGHRNGDAGSDF